MKNKVKIVAEQVESIHMDDVNKDFEEVFHQYSDYQKVKRNFYRLGGLGLCLLSIFIVFYSLSPQQKADSISISNPIHNQESEIGIGPSPKTILEFPNVVSLKDSAKNSVTVITEREIQDAATQTAIEVKPEKDLILAQNIDSAIKQNSPAEPLAGFQNLYEYFYINISYPEDMVTDSIEGVVKVAFTVNPDSSISNLKVLQSLGSALDNEAVRLVENMPRWKPAVENGIVISSSFIMPIRFNIKDKDNE